MTGAAIADAAVAAGFPEMTLLWSSRSPFVRKVVWVASELGVLDRITISPQLVSITTMNADVMADSPLNKIPALILQQGGQRRTIWGSHLICEWLIRSFGDGRLLPAEPEAWLDSARIEVLADGMLDLLILVFEESRRPDPMRSTRHVAAWLAKISNGLDHLERHAVDLERQGTTLGTLAVAALLGYLDFRFADLEWRKGRGQLAAWFAPFGMRPSIRENGFIDA